MQVESQQRAFLFPLAQLAVALAAGILTAQLLAPQASITLTLGLLCVFVSLAALLRIRRGGGRIASILITFAFFISGATLGLVERQDVSPNRIKHLIDDEVIGVGEPIEVTGVLEREPEVAPERLYLNLEVERIRLKGRELAASGVVSLLLVSANAETAELAALDLRYGARIRVMTALARTDNFRNPGVTPFTEFLDRKGYAASGVIKSVLLIERLENDRIFPPLAWLYSWRRGLQAEIDSHFSRETAGVLNAALLGNRYYLLHETAERFREGGTFHVLVISGLHITVLGGLVFLITRRFTKNKLAQFLSSVAILWAYSVAVGAEPSVTRAALMFTVVLLGPLLSRRASSLNSLGIVAIVLLVLQPSYMLDPSFQLTFMSVLAIVVLAWPLLQRLSEIGAWRPTRETPHPPSCAPWLCALAEILYWSELKGTKELERVNYSYKLVKHPLAATIERFYLQRAVRYAFGAIVVSTAVHVTLLPFLVVYFHRLSLASLLLNIGVSLLMAGVAFAALAALAIAQVSSALAAPLIVATEGFNWLMVHSVDPFAKAGIASVRLPEYTGWAAAVYALYYIPLTVLAVSLSNWKPFQVPTSGERTERVGKSTAEHAATVKARALRLSAIPWRALRFIGTAPRSMRLASLAQLFAVALIVWHPWSSRTNEGKLRIDFLDVGQGDAALVTMPDDTTLLIDAGGWPGPFKQQRRLDDKDASNPGRETRSIGESVVSEYLWWRGLDRIDYLVSTHADMDHIDGLNDVARNFAVRAALVARTPLNDPEYARLSETLTSNRIPVRVLGAGDEMRVGNASVEVLWPPASADQMLTSGNNDSLVLRLQFGNRSILLTGDIEAETETLLVDQDSDLSADVVKVGHHGSRTSSTENFISATRSRFAVISVGQHSIFGHPAKEVVERWQASGARVLTTGRSGTITFVTDGRNLEVETLVKEK